MALSGCARPVSLSAQETPPGVTLQPGIFADCNPRWSHDGTHIAFLRATTDRNLQLFIADAKLTRPLALLEPELVSPDRPYNASLQRFISPDTLAWSPDDRRLAFARIEWFTFGDGERLPGTGLWSLDRGTGRVTPLALHPTRYTNQFYYYHTPEWSPDGQYLSFVGEGISGQRVLFVRPLRAHRPDQVQPLFDTYADTDWPAWKPDADKDTDSESPCLMYRQSIRRTASTPPTEMLRILSPGSVSQTSCGERWRINAQTFIRQTASAPHLGETVVPRIGQIVWSPDGQQIAFTLTPDAEDFTRYELWTIRKEGGGARRVSPIDGRGYFAPVWIGTQQLGALSPEGSGFAVVTLRLDGRSVHRIGVVPAADCDWSPDRSRIVYALPPSTKPEPHTATTLRLLETGLYAPTNI